MRIKASVYTNTLRLELYRKNVLSSYSSLKQYRLKKIYLFPMLTGKNVY
ncbi:hypothetical protein EZJ58_1775 [Sodalis ligni]|uniref:Uncharacterized protein n=1 Tax=Sodalis ligni TaxID=2697027 RepID=A0A4R1NAF3_9GAMM|nr:hypothetical protein EZJ58_1775 [Sodalis ligni]